MSEPRIQPIYPSGSNSLESRVKGSEKDLWYLCRDVEELRTSVDSAHQKTSDLARKLEEIAFKAAVWAIAALVSTVVTLALIIVRLKAPWMVSP